jgi:hypothetical protein
MLGDTSKWLGSGAFATLFRVGLLVRGLAGGELRTVPALYARISAQNQQPLIPDRIPSLCCRDRISHESTPNP